jgi:hypothetical protein
MRRAFEVAEHDRELEWKEIESEHERDMQMCAEAEHIFAGLSGVNFEQAVAIKAAQGDQIAMKWRARWESRAYRVHSALVEATMRAHPRFSFEPSGIVRWHGEGEGPSEKSIIDWFQLNHPTQARAIEDSIDAVP